jgi:hypothetical protein
LRVAASLCPRDRRSFATFDALRTLAFAALLAALTNGCVSKSAAAAQARMAYLAGQRDAFMQMQRSSGGPSVTFLGPVNNPAVKWSEGLTLSQGIVKAVYAGPRIPPAS